MKKRDFTDCLYFIGMRCTHVDGTHCTFRHTKHPHWRPRPADKLSPDLRRLVNEAKETEAKICAGGCIRNYADPLPHCDGCTFGERNEAE